MAMTDKRTAKIMQRYKECSDLSKWKAAVALMFASNRGFYAGKNDRDWRADLAYFVRDDVFSKWLDAAEQFTAAGHDADEFLTMMRRVREEEDE